MTKPIEFIVGCDKVEFYIHGAFLSRLSTPLGAFLSRLSTGRITLARHGIIYLFGLGVFRQRHRVLERMAWLSPFRGHFPSVVAYGSKAQP